MTVNMLVSTLLSVALSSMLATVAGPNDLLSNPEAQSLVAQAQSEFSEGNFAEATDLIEKAYLIEPVPELLFPWAQAEREQGNCRAAIDLYGRMLEDVPSGPMADSARQNIERCQEQLGEEADEVAIVDDPIVDDPIEEDPIEEEPEPLPATKEEDEGPAQSKQWYKDPAGGVLTGLGIVGVGVGTGLLIGATSTANNAPNAPSVTDYGDQSDQAVTLRNAGAGALSVGGALLVAGIIRYAIVAKKNRTAATASVWTAPGGGGLVVSGRF